MWAWAANVWSNVHTFLGDSKGVVKFDLNGTVPIWLNGRPGCFKSCESVHELLMMMVLVMVW